MRFKDRATAGVKLAAALERFHNTAPLVVYALPRGGVVIGAIVAEHLGAPLGLIIPRKVGHPYHPEYAIAAVTEDGMVVANPTEVAGIDEHWLEAEAERQRQETKRRRETYLKDKSSPSASGKVAIIVDDGIATGLTMVAAIKEISLQHPAQIIVAVPVVPADVADALQREADEVVALVMPEHFAGSVGAYYDRFEQVEDDEVIKLLEETGRR